MRFSGTLSESTSKSLSDSLNYAIEIARRSPQKRFKMGCVLLDSSGEWLATGWSHMGETRYRRYWSVHAELHAIKRVTGDSAVTAVVARINGGNGLVGYARPCLDCVRLLRSRGISEVYYTTGTEGVPTQRLLLSDVVEEKLKHYCVKPRQDRLENG